MKGKLLVRVVFESYEPEGSVEASGEFAFTVETPDPGTDLGRLVLASLFYGVRR